MKTADMSQYSTAQLSIIIFKESIDKYHLLDKVDQDFENPYPNDSLEHLLYRKNWIDTVQWHYEDSVDDWERQRNDIIYYDFQNNRNPCSQNWQDLKLMKQNRQRNAMNLSTPCFFLHERTCCCRVCDILL